MGDALQVLVYSSDPTTRRQVMASVGRCPHRALTPLAYREIATPAAVMACLGRGGVDLVVLDGEATPAGGLGIARQITDELSECPPIVVLLGRREDDWLARWSRADAYVQWPSDPVGLIDVVVRTLLSRSGSDRQVG